ncbi:MAG: DHA2 family efflux MFS transporter permease subunit [Verrucomicrobia bacterium]|nr:DHA2 family efflux MFS transporter permease subunit [Verrucomicrobiota bacterium]
MPPEPPVSRRDWLAVGAAVLGAFMAVLDIQITNASLRDITGALGATTDEGSWISLGYLLPEIVMIPLSGWLAQVFGLRRFFLGNVALFLLFSVACAQAWDLASMTAFRVAQGATGGTMIPLAFTMILSKLPPSKRPIGFALFGVSAVFAPAIGPTVGGYLTDNFGWPSIFYLNLLPGVFMYAALARALDPAPFRRDLLQGADWAGILAMASGLGCLTFFLEEGNRKDWFGSQEIVWTFWIALVSLLAFIVIELRSPNPFINLRLLSRRGFLVGSIINFVVGAALYGSIYLLPLYLGQMQGYSALQIGETLLWMGLPQLPMMPLASRLTQRVDNRLLVGFGLCFFAFSCYLTGQMDRDVGDLQLRLPLAIRALGFPFVIVAITNIATAGIEQEQIASASGLFNMLRNLGGSVGIAVLGSLLTQREHFHSNHLGEAISLFSAATDERLTQLTSRFVALGYDAVTAGRMALGAIDQTVRGQAFFLAYGDCFKMLAFGLLACVLLVPFCRKPTGPADPAAAH